MQKKKRERPIGFAQFGESSFALLSHSHCWHSHRCRIRTVGIRTVGFALVSFALLSFALLSGYRVAPLVSSHCWPLRTVGIRTVGFALVSFALLSFALLSYKLHFPLPKIRTFRFSLHTSRLSLRGEVTMVALKFAMSSHFPLPKYFSPSGFVSPLSNGTSRATSDRKPKTNDQILPSPIFFPSKKWIKLIPKTIGNRKRDCAWGGSGW